MERLRLDEELRESELRFRTMAELVPVFIYSVGLEGQKDFANPRFREYTGLTEEESSEGGWMRAVHPDDLPRTRQQWADGLAQGKPFSFEFRLRDARGMYRWFRSGARPIRNEQGAIGGWIGSISDIDDLMRAQAELSAANEMLEERVVERTAALATANKELHREYRERQRLEAEMMHISEKERRSLGQDLHDGVCQQLSGLAFMVEGLAHSVEKKGLAKEAADAEELARLVRETTEQARDVARGLHPVDVDANGLVVALRDMAARFTARGPARCTLQCPAPTPVRDNEAAMHATEPSVLLLDEPTAGMNAQETEATRQLIFAIRDLGTSVVVIEHDTKFIFTLCDRVLVLVQGELLVEGTPDEVRGDPRVVEAYLGAPPDEVEHQIHAAEENP
jgi:PAS domain S-box-containing protein